MQGVPALSTQPNFIGSPGPEGESAMSKKFQQLKFNPHSTESTYLTNVYIIYLGHTDQGPI
jgi:hypothetical protein